MTEDSSLEYLITHSSTPPSLRGTLGIQIYGFTWWKRKKLGTKFRSGIYIYSNVQIFSKLRSFTMSALIVSLALPVLLELIEEPHFIHFQKTFPTQSSNRLKILKAPRWEIVIQGLLDRSDYRFNYCLYISFQYINSCKRTCLLFPSLIWQLHIYNRDQR